MNLHPAHECRRVKETRQNGQRLFFPSISLALFVELYLFASARLSYSIEVNWKYCSFPWTLIKSIWSHVLLCIHITLIGSQVSLITESWREALPDATLFKQDPSGYETKLYMFHLIKIRSEALFPSFQLFKLSNVDHTEMWCMASNPTGQRSWRLQKHHFYNQSDLRDSLCHTCWDYSQYITTNAGHSKSDVMSWLYYTEATFSKKKQTQKTKTSFGLWGSCYRSIRLKYLEMPINF